MLLMGKSGSGRYQHLEASLVGETLADLTRRINARFPGRHLGEVAGDLTQPLAAAERGVEATGRYRLLRGVCQALSFGAGVMCAIALVLAGNAAFETSHDSVDWLGLVEAAGQDIVFAGAILVALWTLPRRRARAATLAELHRLRSLAHVIDMHQLAKQPGVVTADDYNTYLTLCAELLALVGKTAALWAEHTDDDVVLGAIAEVEQLTGDTARTIWHKLSCPVIAQLV